jgi:hypothetical protein
MCFSAVVSFAAAGGLALVGIATIRQTTSKREVLLASFPCLFATQQAFEGLVWIGKGHSYYSQFERRFLLGLAIGGFGLGIYLFSWVIFSDLKSQVFSGNLFYDLRFIPFYEVSKYLYVAIISLPFFFVRHSSLKIFGALVVGSFILSQFLFQMTFISVWCFFAAILSGVLYSIVKDLSSPLNSN